MSRYIDAEKTYNFYMIDEMTDEYYIKSMTIDEALSHCDEVIPTADVRENVRGEWLHISDGYCDVLKCSRCGKSTDSQSNFCPNCGAEMRGAQNE